MDEAKAATLDLVECCRECGGMTGWISSTRPAKELAQFASSCVKAGYKLVEMSTEDARKQEWCECDRKANTEQLDLVPAATKGEG